MGIQDIQAFLESAGLEGGAVSVDLLRIARNVTNRQQPHAGNSSRKVRPIGNKLKLIIDAENCLDRLYGGYFSDWACGGQWNRMFHFVSLLTQTVERGNIELAIVFDGTMESNRLSEWIEQQANTRQRVGMVLKHVNTKATPPPKVWWTAPICLRTALRMALRHLGITVISTTDDHRQETIAYCREYGFHGLLADDAEYAAFQPPRYFSSQHIKLTYKGSLETKEYMVSEALKALNITREQLCVVASLLGNFLLGESQLQDVYKKVQLATGLTDTKLTGETAVKSIADYVRGLPSPSNMDDLILEIFGSLTDKRADVFKQSVQYYLNGTAEGFLKYTPFNKGNKRDKKKNVQQNIVNNVVEKIEPEEEIVVAGPEFASETTEQQQESLQNYKLATANATVVNNIDEIVDIESTIKSLTFEDELTHVNGHATNGSAKTSGESTSSANTSANHNSNNKLTKDCAKVNLLVRSNSATNSSSISDTSPKNAPTNATSPQSSNVIIPTVSVDVLRTCSLRHQKGLMSPALLHLLSSRELRLPCVLEDEANRELPAIHDVFRQLRKRIYAVLFNLHHHRYVFSKKKESGEVDDKSAQPPDIVVREYTYTRANPYQRAEPVRAEALPWAVPTLHRLWFGAALDDKRRRMRALLSCLSADTPLILNTAYVPQHMLVMACVLRYIMSYERPILRRNELDVFLCQAFNPDLMNIQYLQELTLNIVTSRGIQLAALFMQGVEMALLANDACGAPLPWLMCCPWLFFDGKLFHHTLTRSSHAKSLLDLCENHIDRVVKVERIRKAILEGLDVKWHKYGTPAPYPVSIFEGLIRQPPPQQSGLLGSSGSLAMSMSSYHHHHQQQHHHPHPTSVQYAAFGAAAMAGAGRSGPVNAYAGLHHHQQQQQQQQHQHVRRSAGAMSGRGGQLQVAGVVVGSWGPNYRIQDAGRQQAMASIGYDGRGGGRNGVHGQQHMGYGGNSSHYQTAGMSSGSRGINSGGGGGANRHRKQGPPTYTVNKKSNAFNKKKNASGKKNSQNRQKNKTEPSVGEASSEGGCKSTEQGQGDGPSLETKCN